MCTAITYKTADHYFGRNLDIERGYGEKIVITPRKYPLHFRFAGNLEMHYAMIGAAIIQNGTPLYFDATNEKGLSMAGLNFPGYAHYAGETGHRNSIAPFEFIPWILGQCSDIEDARKRLCGISIVDESFSDDLPNTPLHWIIADRNCALTIESTKDGLFIHENPAGVLTNSPPFEYHLLNLSNYMHLSPAPPLNLFSSCIPLNEYSRGMGAMGLPGDLSSASRFVRATFTLANAVSEVSEEASVTQFFHILHSVEQQRGCTRLANGTHEITRYTSCCNTQRGVYYYTTYGNNRITGIAMRNENLDGSNLISYPFLDHQDILMLN